MPSAPESESGTPLAHEANLVLGLVCAAGFTFVVVNLVMSPLLPLVSTDMHVSVGVGGLLVTLYAVTAGLGALVAGPLLDRFGRRPLLIGGMLILALSNVATGLAPTFPLLVTARAIAGLGTAGVMPAVFAAVGDLFPYAKRGGAMAWVFTATSSAPIFALPVVSLLAAQLGWRGTMHVLGVLTLLCAVLLWVRLPTRARGEAPRHAGVGLRQSFRVVMGDSATAAAIGVNTINRVFWVIIQIYMGAFFFYTYGMPAWSLGLLNTMVGLGMMLGSNVGGRLADRTGKRPVVLWTSALSTVFVVLMTTAAQPWLWAALACLFIFAAPNGARTASAQAMLTEFSPQHRGMVMALSTSGGNLGQLAASVVGGVVVDWAGYTWLGPVSGLFSLVSLILFWRYVPETTPRQPAPVATVPVRA